MPGSTISENLHKPFQLLITNQKDKIIQLIKFCLVGITNLIVYYAVYMPSLKLLAKIAFWYKIDFLIAQCFGFVVSVLWSFYWNERFVFKKKNNPDGKIKKIAKTYSVYAISSIGAACLSYVWVEFFGVAKSVVPFINLIVTVPTNFLLNKFWVFR